MNIKKSILLLLFVFGLLNTTSSHSQNEAFEAKGREFFKVVWSDTDASLVILDWLRQFAEENQHPEYDSKYLNSKATLYYVNGNYTEAISYYSKSYEFAKQWGDKWQQGIVLNNLGGCLYQTHEYKRAKEYYDIAYQLFTDIGDKDWQTNILYNLASINTELKNYTEAEEQFLKLEKIYLENDNLFYAGYCNRSLGKIYIETNQIQKALHHINLSLERVDKENDLDGLSLSLQNKGLALSKSNNYENGISYIHQSLAITEKNKFNKWTLENYKILSQLFKETKSADSAYKYYEKTIAFKDTIYNENKLKEFATLETTLKTKLKEEEINNQKIIIEQKNLIIKILVIFIIIIIALLLLFFITRIKLLKSRKNLEQSLIEKETLLREIHHRVKNNLQVVSSLLNMHVRKVKDTDSKKILEEGSDRLMAMSLIHKNLYPHSNLKNISLDDYLFKLSHQLFDNYQLHYSQVSLKTELDKIDVDIDKLIPIGLIVNELISNAMKHAFHEASDAEISIKLKQASNNKIELEVADNGQGIPVDWREKESDSIGMKLITIFSEKLKSKLSIQNDNGTVIKLFIPTI